MRSLYRGEADRARLHCYASESCSRRRRGNADADADALHSWRSVSLSPGINSQLQPRRWRGVVLVIVAAISRLQMPKDALVYLLVHLGASKFRWRCLSARACALKLLLAERAARIFGKEAEIRVSIGQTLKNRRDLDTGWRAEAGESRSNYPKRSANRAKSIRIIVRDEATANGAGECIARNRRWMHFNCTPRADNADARLEVTAR